MKSDPNPTPEPGFPRRSFLKGTSAAAATTAIFLTTDAKLRSQDRRNIKAIVDTGDTGHFYMYMEP